LGIFILACAEGGVKKNADVFLALATSFSLYSISVAKSVRIDQIK
jgi:hypothetical protein